MNYPQEMRRYLVVTGLIVLWCVGDVSGQEPGLSPRPPRVLATIVQLSSASERDTRAGLRVELTAWVIAVDRPNATVTIRDDTGAWELRNPPVLDAFATGQKIQLEAEVIWGAGRAALRDVTWTVRAPVSAPKVLQLGDRVSSLTSMEWVQAEGVVAFAGKAASASSLDVAERGQRITVFIVPAPGGEIAGLLHRKIRFRGVAQGGVTPGGEWKFDRVWVDGLRGIYLIDPTIQDWNAAEISDSARLKKVTAQSTSVAGLFPGGEDLIRVVGRLSPSTRPGFVEIADDAGAVLAQVPPDFNLSPGQRVEVLGVLGVQEGQPFVACGFFRPEHEEKALSLLTTVEQIHRLKPEEADRGFPVRIRGVATGGYGYIQDATRGISVSNGLNQLTFGLSYQVEGTTGSGLYAPVICPTKITYLGPGQLPEPIHPTWEYLASGSAVCQWLELQGLVLSATNNWLTLAIPGGRVEAEVLGAARPNLESLSNSIVRIRGTCRSEYNARRQITRFWISVPTPAFVSEEVPARTDPFAAAARSIGEILQFDVDAYQIRRIKVVGQVTYHVGMTGYLTDGTNNLKYFLQEPAVLQPGDHVELVGFPDAGDFKPVFRETIWQKTGSDELPAPPLRNYSELAGGDYNSARIRAEGRLLALNLGATESLLTVLVDSNAITARLPAASDAMPDAIEVGSWVALTGICASRSQLAAPRTAGSGFELLLQSPADLVVLARPSWWTLKRSLQAVGLLALGLVAAAAWIYLLRTKVSERTRQLQAQMQETTRQERQRALEQERSRIARDLHDNLGASLTEISMLAETGARVKTAEVNPSQRFDQILSRAYTLVHTLDETVWAIDPAKDTLPSLVRYLAGFAEEFVATAGISCRVEVPPHVPEWLLTAELRHDLFLATKEALNNAVRHSRGKLVTFQVQLTPGELQIQITDDGRGFALPNNPDGHGLQNLRERMKAPGRRCEITSQPDSGTMVLLAVTLPPEESSALT